MADHSFEIRLFLAATAIAVLGVGVTQAGWKHRAFVQSLFGLSLLFFAVAIFWPGIAEHIPESIDVPLGAISSNLISWLILLAMAIGTVCGLDYWSRSNWQKHFPTILSLLESKTVLQAASMAPSKSQSGDNRQWVSSYKIFDLADPKLIEKTVNYQSEAQRLSRETEANNAEQLKFRPKDPLAAFNAIEKAPPALELLKKKASELYDQSRAAERNHNAAFGELLNDIYEKLASGKLIAKGFLVPVEADSQEIEIPASHWRLIRFHAVGYTQAEGQGIKYVGITVARV